MRVGIEQIKEYIAHNFSPILMPVNKEQSWQGVKIIKNYGY